MLQQLQLFPPTSDNIREDASRAERAQLGACDDASIAKRERAPTTPVVRGKGRAKESSPYPNVCVMEKGEPCEPTFPQHLLCGKCPHKALIS